MPRIYVIAAAVALCLPALASAQDGKRYAVLVGVNEYDHEKLLPLKYAANDATELGELLAKAGYEVTVLTAEAAKQDPKLAPTKANIEARVKSVLGAAKRGDLVLVGLAGHGLQFEGQRDAYFCPSDAKPFKEKADTLVSLKGVYEEFDASLARMKVLLVDACRDDPQAGGRGVGADTAPRPPQGVAAIFSCKNGQRAFEVEKYKHGVFFHHVITGLRGEAADRRGQVTFAGLAEYVGQEVPSDVATLIGGGAVQTPNLKAEYTGASPVLVGKAAPAVQKTDDEQVAADLRAYLVAVNRQESDGFLRALAPRRIAAWKKAAEDSAPAGQFLLARCLRDGIGIDRDEKAGFAWLSKAADARLAIAVNDVGFSYVNGRGVERNPEEAVKWFQKAIDSGFPLSMVNLGDAYMAGRGVPRDEKEAIALFRKAADAGCAAGLTRLGDLHWFGRGVAKDVPAAVDWFRKAANAGHSGAMISLGNIFEQGAGVERDAEEAFRWYTKAAEAGNRIGMSNLGLMYENGRGVGKDAEKAVEWFKKAAALGHPRAMYHMGRVYENGRGVAKDADEAVAWYKKAADRGEPLAKEALKRLGRD